MFPAQCWVNMSSSHPTLDPLHPGHKLSLRVPSLATGNQTQEPPGPLRSPLAGSWHPRAAGSGQATLWPWFGWPQTTHWSASQSIAGLLSRRIQPGTWIYKEMLSASLPLPIVGEEHPELGCGQRPLFNSLTFGLMTKKKQNHTPESWAAGLLCGGLSFQRWFCVFFFPNFSHSSNNFTTSLALNSYCTYYSLYILSLVYV